MSINLTISNSYALLALHKALHECRFSENTYDPVLIGSPYLAEIANQVVDLIIEHAIENNELSKAHQWQNWRIITTEHQAWNTAIKSINDISQWNKWSRENKESYIRTLLSPYTISSELIDLFILTINNVNSAKK